MICSSTWAPLTAIPHPRLPRVVYPHLLHTILNFLYSPFKSRGHFHFRPPSLPLLSLAFSLYPATDPHPVCLWTDGASRLINYKTDRTLNDQLNVPMKEGPTPVAFLAI